MKILLLGLGNVGRAFCELVEDRSDLLRDRHGIDCCFVGIATRSRGAVVEPDGIPVRMLLDRESSTGRLDSGPPSGRYMTAMEMVEKIDYDLLVVCTSTTIRSPEVPMAYIKGALNRGIDVITSNKGPLFLSACELIHLAKKNRASFLFEAAVLGGTPFFSFVRHCLKGSRILSCEGVMNTTTNYILDLMVAGSSFDDALLDARRKGFTEADPTFDVEGWDSAVKGSIIAQVLFRVPPVPLEAINIEGITQITPGLLIETARSGGSVRLVTKIEAGIDSVSISVRPEALPATNPLSRVHGATNGAIFETDTIGEVFLAGGGIGPRHTAYSLLRDLIETAEFRNA